MSELEILESPAKASHDPSLPVTSSDFMEQDHPEFLDNIVPTRGYQMPPMVALGGSAGSIGPLQEFFRAMPADSGIVFVVILHLSPTHESALAELLGRVTAMPVVQATNGQKVIPNQVYVIPPGKDLSTVDGHLRLSPLDSERGRRVVVDLFLRSLADTHGHHGAAIILSGVDGDGALGIKRIKERGGLTIAQDPEEAEHDGMPRSAINTGMVDWVLPVAQMPQRLVSYFHQEKALILPPEEGPQPAQPIARKYDEAETALREVLVFLRTRTGRDFSYYKRATILRRIARRMQVNDVDDLPGYLGFLRTHPGEAGALLQDLLISVTNFFRDRDSFAALESIIPQLFSGKVPGEAVRVWVPACATGEEAYSIAILLLEYARHQDDPPLLQVFACDLDDEAIAKARAGLYPAAMVADVSEERVKRFFIKDPHGYRVRRELREMVLFATHDLLKDPPFSRMDLVSCRNLLIYLNRSVQTRVHEIFHFALRPNGFLFLGSSEALDEGSPLFRTIDKKHRIYGHKSGVRTSLVMPAGAGSLLRAIDAQEHFSSGPVLHGRSFLQEIAAPFSPGTGLLQNGATLADLHLRLLERIASPSILINAEHEIVHLSETAGRMLNFVGGEPTCNLLRLVDPAVRADLRAALVRAGETSLTAEVRGLHVEVDGQPYLLDLRVTPATEIAPGFTLVVFESRLLEDADSSSQLAAVSNSMEPLVPQLERELERVKTQLRDTVDKYEAGTEELKASNEELQAMNEELRSATEELETSREELQSINEELTTVNHEMKGKVDELGSANADLQNLMASTAIPLIFLDRDLAITRYTPSAVELFHLIPGDLGRPLSHLKHRLDYSELLADAEQVLQTLIPLEREVSGAGRWFLSRVRPYRTPEDHIGGVVLTLLDITERKQRVEVLRTQMEEISRFNSVAVGRESRMIDLKKEINEFCVRLGETARYPLAFEEEQLS